MNTNIFKIDTELPKNEKQVTIFTTQTNEETRSRKTTESIKMLSKLFDINGEPSDNGEKIILTQKSKSVTIYPASNSFWYQDDDYFAKEEKKFSLKLPDNRVALENAVKFLKESGLLLNTAKVDTVTHTTVATSNLKDNRIDEYNTEVHVNFRYMLDNLPVYGPGAKTRVSFISERVHSGVYHFWREVMPLTKKREVIDPELAMNIHAKNFRFANLKEGAAKVTIEKMELGYYALPPTDIQHALIPVYKISGVVSTEALPEYKFNHHVVAVKYSEADVKTMGFNIGNVKSLVF